MGTSFFNSLKIQFFTGDLTNKNNFHSIKLGIVLLVTISVFTSFLEIDKINGQSTTSTGGNQVFKIIIKVTNSGNIDLIGTIHVAIDGSFLTKDLTNIQFPAKQTVSHTVEFNSQDVPTGKGFSVEVVYADDMYKRTYGTNTPANTPEIVTLVIP